jgi:hypothetical protein
MSKIQNFKIQKMLESGMSEADIVVRLRESVKGIAPHLHRKTNWLEAKEDDSFDDWLSRQEYASLAQTLEGLDVACTEIINIPAGVASWDVKLPSSHTEYIVNVEGIGYFYVSTEGYDYARYICYLDTWLVEEILLNG